MKTEGLNIGKLYRKYGILIVLAVLFVAACILNPNFSKPANLVNVMKQITPATIIAVGMTMLICSGGIDLAAGMEAALAACISAKVMASTNSLILGVLVAILVGAACSYASSLVITLFNVPAFIATLATSNVCSGLVIIITGGSTIRGVDKLKSLSQGSLFGVIPYMIILLTIVLIVGQVIMRNTRFGLYMYGIGGNPKAAIASGINAKRQLRLTYIVSGIMIGIAAITLEARMMAAHPNVGPGYEFDAITATVVGGTSFTGGSGSMYCVIIGSVIIGIINNLMVLMGIDTSWQNVIKGILIALAVTLDIMTRGKKK